MKRIVVAAIMVMAGLTGSVRADDKANPTGTWKWTITINDQKMERTLKLKLDGAKLTGSMPGRDGKDIEIQDGSFKDGTVTFNVVRERDGQKFTVKFNGKVSGDTIKGKREFERNGETMSSDWEATRAKDDK